MTTAKSLFLKRDPEGKESLAQWWVSIAHDTRFLQVLTFVRADMMESRPTSEKLEGAQLALLTLQTIAENEEDMAGGIPDPGLVHRFEPQPHQD